MGIRLECGARIDDFTVLEYKGSGGEADAYFALSPDGHNVIVKQHKRGASGTAKDPDTERVLRVARLVGKRCPWVCEIYKVFTDDGLLYVVEEYVEGRSLDEMLGSDGRLFLEAFLPIAHDILFGLGWLHDLGIVHRDVKPGNILVAAVPGTPCRAKLIDVDTALHRGLDRVTVRGGFVGTPFYAPPESLRGDKDMDGRADLYSFGVVFFECVTGHFPFPTDSMEALIRAVCNTAARPEMRDYLPDIPPPLDACVQRLMSPGREDRPASAQQAWDELSSTLAGVDLETAWREPHTTPGAGDTAEMPAADVAAGPAAGAPRLFIKSGPLAGTTLLIPARGIALGRNAVNPTDSCLSRAHFRAKPCAKGLLARDLGSRNGLIVGAKRLRKVLLAPGDELLVGATILEYLA